MNGADVWNMLFNKMVDTLNIFQFQLSVYCKAIHLYYTLCSFVLQMLIGIEPIKKQLKI